jgi:uroporphyrinogen decarboxylase
MNSRDRVLTAMQKQIPDRLPMFCGRIDDIEYWLSGLGLESEAKLRAHWGLDIQKMSYGKAFRLPKGKTIWGAEDNWDAGYSSLKDFPLKNAETIADVEKHAWPDSSMVDFDEISTQLKGLDQNKARIGSIGFQALFCTLCDLFGMDNAMINMSAAPELIDTAVAHIEAFLMDSFGKILRNNANDMDFLWWGDDFSTQRCMMISPEMWRRFLKPTYLRVFELIKSYDVMIWFHSCGTFAPVIGELVDAGMDVWETVQAHLEGNEPEKLKANYGNNLSFFGAISCQGTLPFGSPEDVRKEVRERFRVLGKNGGYIIGPDHSIQKNMPIANLEALFDEAHKCVYG